LGAELELQETYESYEERREGLGAKFLADVETYFGRVADHPQIAPVFIDNIRRQVMARFPFGIFYEPFPTRIIVNAVLNLHQRDEQIIRRLRRKSE
jgi:hypothetical protein